MKNEEQTITITEQDSMTPPFKRWTKKDDATLRLMIKQGKNSEEIATLLKRSRAAIMARKSLLGIKTRLVPAKGSQMPYVSFKRNRLMAHQSVDASEIQKYVVEERSQDEDSLGQQIEKLYFTAKRMGVSLKITIES